jgi:hypothetical protein
MTRNIEKRIRSRHADRRAGATAPSRAQGGLPVPAARPQPRRRPNDGPATEPSSGVELPSSFYDALRRGGNIVEAVKIYRDTTSVGLADAKKAVEAIARANS